MVKAAEVGLQAFIAPQVDAPHRPVRANMETLVVVVHRGMAPGITLEDDSIVPIQLGLNTAQRLSTALP